MPTSRPSSTGRRGGIRSFAGGLSARGFAKGDVLALMAPNLPEYAIVFHGAALAGGIVTTINPTYTAEEVRTQLRDSGATLLVTIGMFLDTARPAAEGTGVTPTTLLTLATPTVASRSPSHFGLGPTFTPRITRAV